MSRPINKELLFQNFGDMIFRYCSLHTKNMQDAQDVYQEVFLRLYQKKPIFKDEEHAKAWLLRVSMNLCKSYHRTSFLHPFVEFDEKLHVPYKKEGEPTILYSLRKLPSKYRSVLYLYYFEGYSCKEIAELLHRPDATIRTWLSRGKLQLEEILREDEQSERIISRI